MFTASDDPHLNDIPLARWDGMTCTIREIIDRELWKKFYNTTYGEADQNKFIWSMSCGVCIGKASARILIEENKA